MAETKSTAATTAAAKKTSSTSTKPAERTFAPNDQIPCRSITHGELIFEGRKSKLQYRWENINDVTYVSFEDLQAAHSMKSKFLTTPYFIIEDEDLVQKWSPMLSHIYENINHENIEEMFKLSPARLRQQLKIAPEGVKKTVKSMVAAQIVSGEFDSISRIKVIDEVLGTELLSMIS